MKRTFLLSALAAALCAADLAGIITAYAATSDETVYVDGDTESLSLLVGDTCQLVLSESGDATYASSDETVVTVDESGSVEAVAAGEASISVSVVTPSADDAYVYTIDVNVEKNDPQLEVDDVVVSFTLDPVEMSVSTASDGALSYEVDDLEMISVDEEGAISIRKIGTTTVTVTVAETDAYLGDSVEASVTVNRTVSQPVIDDVERDGDDVTVTWGAVDNATEYALYQKKGSGTWKRAKVVDADALEHTVEGIESNVTYSYKVRAYGVSRKDYSTFSVAEKIRYLLAPDAVTVSNQAGYVEVGWTDVTGADGYYVYRDGERIRKVTTGDTYFYHDSSAKNGTKHTYSVAGYHDLTASVGDKKKAGLARLKAAKVKKLSFASSSKKKKRMTVTLSKNSKASGYEVQYSSNPLFLSKKRTVRLSGSGKVKLTVKGLKKKTVYYVRARAYKKVDGKTYRSAWKYSGNVKSTKKAKVTFVKSKGKRVELRARSKQKMYGYDTVQGGCTDGKYAYYVMYKRTVEKGKIVKVRLSTMKVVKTSKVLPIAHGNDVTYNSDTNRLVVANSSTDNKTLTIVNPKTLKVVGAENVKLDEDIFGITDSQASNQHGYCGITYNSKRKQYVLLARKTGGNLVILNEDFEPIKYIRPAKKDGMLLQGLDSTNDFILVYSSFHGSKNYNVVSAYDWNGNFVTRINVGSGYELENVFHVGSKFYMATYQSRSGVYYTTAKKKVKGKTKTVKVKHNSLHRDNYVRRVRF